MMRGFSIIAITFLISLVLSILPMPESLQLYRIQWTALVLIYWCMAVPERVGVGAGFLVGLLLDILTGTLLGQHALGLSVISFITIKTYRRVRVLLGGRHHRSSSQGYGILDRAPARRPHLALAVHRHA